MPFLAAPLAAIGGFITSTLAAGGLGAFALQLGGSLLLSAASKALQKKPNSADKMRGRTVSVREPVVPREIVYARCRKGGTIVFMHTSGENNDYLDLIIALAGHNVQEIGNIYFNGELAIAAGQNGGTGRYAGRAFVWRKAGEEAFPELRSRLPGLWTSAHRLQGVSAVHLWLVFNADTYPSGIPNITADIFGKNDILDPRTGLRGYTDNAALCLADYMSLDRFGLGAKIGAADGINQAELIASANVCDENVPVVGGGTERRYTCNGVLSTFEAPKANIEALLTAMAGTCAYQAGQWSLLAGYYRTPSVTLTDDDVRESGVSLATRISRSENFNAVRGTFISPENDWQPDDFPAYESATYLLEDNGERSYRDISLPFTISASTAQRLAKIELERQRRQHSVVFAGKLPVWRVGVGDVVMLSRSRWGYSAKPFDVSEVTLDLQAAGDGAALLPRLTLRETSPLVYDWNTTEAQVYAAAPRTTLPNAFDIAAPGTPAATESQYQTLDGSGVKVKLTLAWPPSQSPFVAQYQIETRLFGATQWATQGRTDDTRFEMLDWAPGDWEFQVKAISKLGVSSGYAMVRQEVVGLGAPPAALTGVTLQAAGGIAVLKWELHPDLDVRVGGFIRIRHSAAVVPTWANSVSMDSVPGGTAQALPPLKPGAYILRAEDQGGNLGPETVILSGGAQVLPFLAGTTLTEDATFTGTKTGTVLDSGTLRLDTSGNVDAEANFDVISNLDALGGAVASGSYAFATALNLGSVKSVRLRSAFRHTIVGILDNVDIRPGTVDTWISFDGTDGGEVDVVVETRTTTDNPAGSPVWGQWGRTENTEVQAWGVQARAILTTSDAGYTPAVDQLRLIAQEVA